MQKHLSPIANSLLQKSAEILDTYVVSLVEEFELGLKQDTSDYARKLVEFCSSKALTSISPYIDKKIVDGSFSRFTFDMMLAWESPSSLDEEMHSECVAKEREDFKSSAKGRAAQEHEDVPLFYSDLMPLLVADEQSVGEDAVVWLASLIPLFVDIVNAQFAFEALTASTANRLHFPAYDIFLKEMDKHAKYLQEQATPTGVKLRDDEFILHVEGTASTQRVVRQIGATSWPGRLTLTNYALYFEASGVISYEKALEIDLSRVDVDHKVVATATGPWGAPLFDKAMAYESSQLPESIILEFPEMISSSRRDQWLTLTKEVILLHKFLSKFMIDSPMQAWEMHCRTILGILRLHAAREMLKIFLPVPRNFLVLSLFDELPKGDYVVEELANSLKQMNSIHLCSATSILESLNMSPASMPNLEQEKGFKQPPEDQAEKLASLESTISQVREEAEEVHIAKASVEAIKEEGVTDSVLTLLELLSPLRNLMPVLRKVLSWEKPAISVLVFAMTMVIIYKEWIGYTLAASLMVGVATTIWARKERLGERYTEVVVNTSSEQTTMESIVSAQHGLKSFHSLVQTTNITIMRILSILVSRAPKHTNQVMLAMVVISLVLVVIPFKFILMGIVLYVFVKNSQVGKMLENEQSERRWREWWNSIPVVPVRTISKTS